MSNDAITNYVGEQTLTRMRGTKWWLFAQILGEALYNGHVCARKYNGKSPPAMSWELTEPSEGDKPDDRAFFVGNLLHVFNTPEGIACAARVGENRYDFHKALHELKALCERMALKEVT